MENTARWRSDWFWYINGSFWSHNYSDSLVNKNWSDLEGWFWYINLHSSSELQQKTNLKYVISSYLGARYKAGRKKRLKKGYGFLVSFLTSFYYQSRSGFQEFHFQKFFFFFLVVVFSILKGCGVVVVYYA
jgi:hypothetical protein